MYGMSDPDCPVDLAKLTASIKVHEGTGPMKNNRFMPYRDASGKLTIAYGRNLDDTGLSIDEGDYLLENNIADAISAAQVQPWWPWVADSDARARAFIEIGFNIGFRALAGFHEAVDAASRRDWPACAAAFLDSLWHRQTGHRAEVLARMILTGCDSILARPSVTPPPEIA